MPRSIVARLEPVRFLCASCQHLMVPPRVGGEKGRSVQHRRCPRNCKYPSRSVRVLPRSLATGSGLGIGKARNSVLLQPMAGVGGVQARRPAITSLLSQSRKGWLRSGVVCWRGARQIRMCPVVRFPCPMRGRELVGIAPMPGCCSSVEPCSVGKPHDRATPFVLFF